MYEYIATLDRIVDGDTIDIMIDLGFDIVIKKRVRVLGLDCPETRTKNLCEKSWGKAATRRVEELLTGKSFVIETHLEDEKYGRVLAHIMLPDESGDTLTQRLIDEGLGVPYDGGSRAGNRSLYKMGEVWDTKMHPA